MSLILDEHPDLGLSRLAADDRLELAVDRELDVAEMIRQRRIGLDDGPRPVERREVLEVVRDVLEAPALVVDRERPGVPDGLELRALGRLVEIDRRQQRPVGPLGELVALGRDERAQELRPIGVVELRARAGAVEDVVVLKDHVPDRDRLLGDDREVAVGAPDREQAGEAVIDMRRGERVEVRVVPVGPLRHVGRHFVGVGVRRAGRHVEEDVVRIALGADVEAVGVEVERRLRQLRGIERHLLALRRVFRVVEVADGEIRSARSRGGRSASRRGTPGASGRDRSWPPRSRRSRPCRG